ncbi:MAG: hypothetical protein HYS13_24250 [Planctomycetia bacterium]|nr:hypothetical protein [Planctomycetia bacterium]
MSRRKIQVVLVCEDAAQQGFFRDFLIERGVHHRAIRVERAPRGKGAGDQFVFKQFPVEVQYMRTKPHIFRGLVAVVDADTNSVDERLRELDAALVAAQLDRTKPTEPIARIVPKRNIETWIFRLKGNTVNEDDDYKRKVEPADIKPAAREFARRCPQAMADQDPPSLHSGCKELQRFLSVCDSHN